MLQNVYQVIAKQTRDEIGNRVSQKYGVQDDKLNVSYWFPYQGRLYQLGTTEEDPEYARSDFDADQNVEPTLIGCAFDDPNHSVQWDMTGGIVIVDSYGKTDTRATKCKFKMLPNKRFQSMVCTTYAPPSGPTVGICAFTDNTKYILANDLVSDYLRERGREYYSVVADLLREGKILPQKDIVRK